MIKPEYDNGSIRTARKSITPSGWFGHSSNMICEIENVITEEEQAYLLEFTRNNNTFDVTKSTYNENGTIIYDSNVWVDRVCTVGTLLEVKPDVVPMLRGIVEKMRPVVENFFQAKVWPTDAALVRWRPGDLQMPHADKELHEGPDAGTDNEFPWYDLGTVFYLNDDYEGGELYFPRQGIEFKPKARAAYIFPGDQNFIHGV